MRGNLAALGLAGDVHVADAAVWLRTAPSGGAQYDLVLLDPPYGTPLTGDLAPILAPGARVVTESDRRRPLELALPRIDERRYGDTLIRIHRP